MKTSSAKRKVSAIFKRLCAKQPMAGTQLRIWKILATAQCPPPAGAFKGQDIGRVRAYLGIPDRGHRLVLVDGRQR